uniref:Uncharacterized protein n=1 Tax=Picea glauca TaxID=3330 RepID=A0A101LW67_PICGL|nr:hypothetical protein ABT39_MTgene1779 [Picea glauca]
MLMDAQPRMKKLHMYPKRIASTNTMHSSTHLYR